MTKRKIIRIAEEKCNGCGLCIPNCPEGAIQMIDGKARLVSDLFCDGLGACIGKCPQGAIAIEERDAQGYDEKKVMANIIKQGKNVIRAHLGHLEGHGQKEYLQQALDYLKEEGVANPLAETPGQGHRHTAFSGCPGSKIMDFKQEQKDPPATEGQPRTGRNDSHLRQWPVQIMLVPPYAPYLNDVDLLIAADCVPFAYADFHDNLLKGKTLLVGCPKLDDVGVYREKLAQILQHNSVHSITYAHMEVPCCFGLVGIIQEAIATSGKKIPFNHVAISVRGQRL
jgi:Pyruvate/2-oxoacid:ferredoxin oxidoreductase delta subunit